MLFRFLLIVLLAVMAGCGRVEATIDASAAKERMEARVRRAQELAAQPPKVTRHATSAGELLVLEVPVALPYGLVDTQHCFVWRDAEFHTATVSCPNADAGPGHSE